MSQHALLSPSSAHRWLACPASVAASAGLQDKPSEHAAEGTLAHDLAACALETGTDAPDTHPELQVYLDYVRAIPGELWPAGPLHRGELRPDIGQASYPVLARTLAGWVDAPALRDRLLHAEERERAQTRPDMAGASLRPQVKRVAEELAATGGPEVTTFLARLDDELRRLDVVNALAKRKEQPTVPIRHCVWRASDGKAVRLHLAELADGRFGLLCKLKGRYRWMEGERDEILASVPEEWFAGAVSAALT